MPTKQFLYAKEQEQIIQSLIDILDLHNRSSFIRYHLDRDNQLIARVMSLVPSIRLYFASSAISGIAIIFLQRCLHSDPRETCGF